jgi:predicted PurR-regulated permease PerM
VIERSETREPPGEAREPARPRPPLGLDPATARVTWTVLVIAVALMLLYVLRHVLVLLVFSVFFAYLLIPAVTAAQRWLPGMRQRTRAIALVYVLLLGGLALAGTAIGPRITTEVGGLAERVPQVAQQISSGSIATGTLERLDVGWETIRRIEATLRSHAGEVLNYVQGAATAVLKWLGGAWVIVLIPIFAFFILKDGEALVAGVTDLIAPGRHRQRLLAIAEDLHTLLGGYMRALVLLSLITFAVWSLVFWILGVPYPIVLAVIGGLLEVIPMVGPVAAAIIALTVAGYAGYQHILWLFVFVVAWRFIQDYLTSPMVMGRGIEIHPAFVIVGVVVGGELAGPVGMFLSIPVMAGLRIIWRHAGPR